MSNITGSDDRGVETSSQTDFTCPSCFSKNIITFHQIDDVPVHSVLNIPSCEAAINFPKGTINLGFCKHCGFISNYAFDPVLLRYSSDCEESQGFSDTFNEFARQTAEYLIEKYGIYNKTILEIGCGKGEFLSLLCDLGNNRGIGFDPAYVEGRPVSPNVGQIKFIKDFYSEKYANYYGDLICCKMTLEHINDTGKFIGMIRRAIGDQLNAIVFFQVPDVIRILRDCSFEDIYYEHCSYFSPGSLARLFRKCGFEILALHTEYDDQYIFLEAKPVDGALHGQVPVEKDYEGLDSLIENFRERYRTFIESWNRKLKDMKKQGLRIVIWGSGSKGVSFLTTLKIYDEIEYVVDINPYRQGTYMAGTGQLIVAPDFLKKYKPDIVIVMNRIYVDEIRRNLNKLGINPHIMALGSE